MTSEKQHWTAEPARYVREMADWQIRYNPTPGGRRNADGSTSHSLTFPVLRITEYVNDPEQAAKDVAAALNREPALIAALKDAQQALGKLGRTKSGDKPWVYYIPNWDECLAAEAAAGRVLAQVSEAEDAR